MSRKLLLGVSLLMALALLVTACTPTTTAPPTKAPESKPAESTAPQPTKPPEAKPSVLVYGQGGDAVMLDAANVTDGFSFKVSRQIYDTLVDFEGDTFKIIPSLATEWKVSADGKEWTLKLRQGVKFHDGTPFNAEAVKFNFDRWMYTKNEYHVGGSFEYWADMWGGYKDGDDGDNSVITEVIAQGEDTVIIKLTRPVAPFLLNIAMPPFGIASPTAIKKDKDTYGTPAGSAVGTGPFIYKDWVKDDRVTLTANPDYFLGKPGVDQVVIRAIKDNSARLAALKAGEIHIADNMGPDDINPIQTDPNLTVTLRPAFNIAYVAFNNDMAPFDNLKVRQAFAHAIDKEAIVDGLYGGTGTAAIQFMPPSIALGYHKDLKEAYEYNPDKAKQLLAEAGFAKGLETDFWYMPVSRPYYPTPQKVAEAIAADLARAGITANLKTVDWGAYLEQRRAGQMPVYMLGWTGDNGDPDNFLGVFFGKKSAGWGNYDNKQVQGVLAEAASIVDEAKREQLYRQATELIQKDCPWIAIAHANPPLGVSKKISDFKPHPTGGESWHTVKVQP